MPNKKAIKLNKYLDVVLGRTPDKFGLLPDKDGYVKTKELLKALAEDKGFGPVNVGLLKEVLLTVPSPSIEMDENRIRATDRSLLPQPVYAEEPPKLLFFCIRNRAHAAVLERGLESKDGLPIKLAADEDTAIRFGKRKDADPVLITVNVAQAFDGGVLFRIYGETLYLCDFLPKECLSGPPLPKEDPAAAQKAAKAKEKKKRALDGEEYHPGSYFPDFGEDKWEQADPEYKKKKKREIREKKLDKKKDIRNKRREKNKMFEDR